jgi:hypothetical protein
LPLDLLVGNDFARAIIQAKAIGDHEEIIGDGSQRLAGHALSGEVVEEGESFLDPGARAMTGQRTRPCNQLIEHGRTSEERKGWVEVRQ